MSMRPARPGEIPAETARAVGLAKTGLQHQLTGAAVNLIPSTPGSPTHLEPAPAPGP